MCQNVTNYNNLV